MQSRIWDGMEQVDFAARIIRKTSERKFSSENHDRRVWGSGSGRASAVRVSSSTGVRSENENDGVLEDRAEETSGLHGIHLEYSIDKLINEELEPEIVNEILGPGGVGIEKMLEESPSLVLKRDKLNRSVGRLREAKEVVGNILDRIATFGG